jgi:hypothetical protein
VLLDLDSDGVDLAPELVDLRGGDGMGGDRWLLDGRTAAVEGGRRRERRV